MNGAERSHSAFAQLIWGHFVAKIMGTGVPGPLRNEEALRHPFERAGCRLRGRCSVLAGNAAGVSNRMLVSFSARVVTPHRKILPGMSEVHVRL